MPSVYHSCRPIVRSFLWLTQRDNHNRQFKYENITGKWVADSFSAINVPIEFKLHNLDGEYTAKVDFADPGTAVISNTTSNSFYISYLDEKNGTGYCTSGSIETSGKIERKIDTYAGVIISVKCPISVKYKGLPNDTETETFYVSISGDKTNGDSIRILNYIGNFHKRLLEK